MFEFLVAKKYLIPNKKQLSSSLIALVSVIVISLVVFLLLLFLSITEGMEKMWLKKLTALNAPIKITPTPYYHQSYYHLIDTISSASDFTSKSLKEKLESPDSDPYNPDQDPSIPAFWPKPDIGKDGRILDPVKTAYKIFQKMQDKDPSFIADDYEATGVMIKLKLVRPSHLDLNYAFEQSFLSQMCYAASLSATSSYLHDLIQPPSKEDIEHLIFLSSLTQDATTLDGPTSIDKAKQTVVAKRLQNLFAFTSEMQAKLSRKQLDLNPDHFQEGAHLSVLAHVERSSVTSIVIPSKPPRNTNSCFQLGTLEKKEGKLLFHQINTHQTFDVSKSNIYFENDPHCQLFLGSKGMQDGSALHFSTKIQNQTIQGKAPLPAVTFENINILTNFSSAPATSALWPIFVNKTLQLPYDQGLDEPIILPKNFKDNGVLIGDKGFLSYGVTSPTSMQEQRLAVYVAGFYDPGVLSVGNRCILLKKDIVHSIASASENLSFDSSLSAGIQVWYANIYQTRHVAETLKQEFKDHGIDAYFTITPFYDYDFAKDLAQQFQSDKYLFSLIGVVILIVACSNIISFLILMINDKKKEIAILQSMGASSKSITMIFSLCGAILGFLGTALGSIAAYFTLLHINQVVNFLSLLQGQALFHEAFYGSCLPTTLSSQALIFLLITAPLLSLLAGLVPALKTAKLNPSDILRSS